MEREKNRKNKASKLVADPITPSQASTFSQSVRPNRKSHPFGDLTHRSKNIELLHGLQFGTRKTLYLVDIDIRMIRII